MSSANSSENVGVAFALVIAAGAATGFGAGVVYVPKLVSLASCRTLAMSLGFSAGVMVFVSFAEIFRKSTSSFEGAGWSNDAAFSLSMVCFFAGVIIMLVRSSSTGIVVSFPASTIDGII